MLVTKNNPIIFSRWLKLASTDQVIIAYNDKTLYMNTIDSFLSSRVSVDSGRFTPGEFRINSYEHGSEQAVNQACSGKLRGKTQVGGYYYEYLYEGPIGSIPYVNVYIWGRPTVASMQTERDITLQKAYAKVGAALFSGGENIGEIRETLNFLRHPLKDLRDFLLKDRKRNLKLLRALLASNTKDGSSILKISGKTAANTWLELRYGLRPLVYDVISAIKLVMKKVETFDPSRIRVARSKLNRHRVASGNCSGGNSVQLKVDGRYYAEHDITVMSCVYFKQAHELSMSRKLGIDICNIPETIWELTRLSFVVDWFINVGAWLGSFRYNPDITFLGSTTSYKVASNGSITPLNVSGMMVGTEILECDFSSPTMYTATWFNRVVNTDGPPSLPQFSGLANLDLPRLVDGLSLILQGIFSR